MCSCASSGFEILDPGKPEASPRIQIRDAFPGDFQFPEDLGSRDRGAQAQHSEPSRRGLHVARRQLDQVLQFQRFKSPFIHAVLSIPPESYARLKMDARFDV